jgi:hypothetical protein
MHRRPTSSHTRTQRRKPHHVAHRSAPSLLLCHAWPPVGSPLPHRHVRGQNGARRRKEVSREAQPSESSARALMATGGQKNCPCTLISQPFMTRSRLRLAYSLNQSWLQAIGQRVCVRGEFFDHRKGRRSGWRWFLYASTTVLWPMAFGHDTRTS